MCIQAILRGMESVLAGDESSLQMALCEMRQSIDSMTQTMHQMNGVVYFHCVHFDLGVSVRCKAS